MSATTFTATVSRHDEPAIDCIAQASGISKQKIKDAMMKGAVWVTLGKKQTRLRRATKTFPTGTQLSFYYDQTILALEPKEPVCLYKSREYSIWYKPSGLHSQGTQWGDHCSLLRWVEKLAGDAFLIHRLDADASGLVVVGHTGKAAAQLSALFQTRNIEKHYEAWVEGDWVIPAGGLTLANTLDGKASETEIISAELVGEYSKVLVNLKTGRKHQIRRHLSLASHPIVGDKLYGNPAKIPLQLCAYHLKFSCPFNQKMIDITLTNEMRLCQLL